MIHSKDETKLSESGLLNDYIILHVNPIWPLDSPNTISARCWTISLVLTVHKHELITVYF